MPKKLRHLIILMSRNQIDIVEIEVDLYLLSQKQFILFLQWLIENGLCWSEYRDIRGYITFDLKLHMDHWPMSLLVMNRAHNIWLRQTKR